MTDTIAVAVSGGVDSLFTAYLLAHGGHRVLGIHFVTGYEPGSDRVDPMDRGARLAEALSGQLGIPVHVVDLRQAFTAEVVDYFVREYDAGRTPNPCMMCNPTIKFGRLFDAARALGAHRLATGHYARIAANPNTGRHELFAGADPSKDQSYFLARLTQDQLAGAVMPLGDRIKASVRADAASQGLSPVTAEESQDICFLPQGQYRQFLLRHRPQAAAAGPIDHVDGRRLGEHRGLYRYTIGQRRGIDIPADRPYYVVAMDTAANRLVVGDRDALHARAFLVERFNWIATPPTEPFAAAVRIRYRSPAAPAIITPLENKDAEIRFDAPQTAITPGQGAVVYSGNRVLGGGWIRAVVSGT